MRSFLLLVVAAVANAHTLVRSVYVNGVDQGTNFGIRPPAMNGPPRAGEPPFIDGSDSGTGSWPIRDINLPDLRCNIRGEVEAPNTVKVVPGDIVSFEWGHRSRQSTDGIIESSHKGAIAVYMAPAPGGNNSWVKIFEEAEYAKDQWAVVPKLINNRGVHSVRIPYNLKPGFYLLRPELFTLHEADVAHTANPNRGIQLYTECVQIQVQGNGTVSLPAGVSFPGAYKYSDPGIVYNLYFTPAGSTYTVPGPRVWTGAAPSVTNPPLGTKKGPLTYTRWSTWVGPTDRIMTWTGAGGLTSTPYVPTWPSECI
ncbi:endoglucanase B [Coprinopsis sp. MPI-PUGE-AT-0042]|nr:endoglucanase B [Coprinopsis sp. MPI-PUGE-AT-0042]